MLDYVRVETPNGETLLDFSNENHVRNMFGQYGSEFINRILYGNEEEHEELEALREENAQYEREIDGYRQGLLDTRDEIEGVISLILTSKRLDKSKAVRYLQNAFDNINNNYL